MTNSKPRLTHGVREAYVENSAPQAISTELVLTDFNSLNLVGAIVRFERAYSPGQDILGFANQNGIVGSFDEATGALTLTGVATVAQYEVALRSVTYFHSGDDPERRARKISFQVDDGDAENNLSSARSIRQKVIAINDQPLLVVDPTLIYVNSQASELVDGTLTLTDPDSYVRSAVIRITTNYVQGEDVLAFAGSSGISGRFDAATGTLTLRGSASAQDYQDALRSVTYTNTSATPSQGSRTITIQVADARGSDVMSNVGTVNVIYTAPPVVVVGTTPVAYTEGDQATTLDAGLTLRDSGDATLVGATISFTAGFDSGDILLFVDTLEIRGSYESASGVLTLSGNATVAQYQAALRSVQFVGVSEDPATTKTVSWVVNDGSDNSVAQTTTISVTAVNDVPDLAISATLAYTENDAAAVIAPAATIADADSADFNGGSLTVSFTANGSAADQLAVRHEGSAAGQIGVSGASISYEGTVIGSFSGGANGADLVITLSSAAATPEAVQALTRNITFANTSDNPSPLARTVGFTLVDGDGGTGSDAASATVNVNAVNDAPVLTASGGSTAYTEAGAAVAIDVTLSLTDSDSATLSSATVQITDGYQSGQDALAFTNLAGMGNISAAAFDTSTATLTLTSAGSTATLAQWQAALRAVTFDSESTSPGASRTISFQVSDGEAAHSVSTVQTKTLAITEINSRPVITITGGSAAFVEDAGAVTIDSGIAVNDQDSASLAGASVKITTGFSSGQDVLTSTAAGDIDGSFDAATGILTLSGAGTLAEYAQVLASVQYNNSSSTPSTATRTIVFQVDDGQSVSSLSTAQSRTVTVAAANGAPVIVVGATLAYTENDEASVIAPVTTVIDTDSADFSGGTFTISLAANGTAADQLAVRHEGTAAGQIGVSGSTVSFGGTTIGTMGALANGTNGADLVITFTSAAATPAAVQALARNITFRNNSDTPSTSARTVSFTLVDGDGGSDTSSADATVNVTSVNDTPGITSFTATALSYTEDDGATLIDDTLVLSDLDSTSLTGATVSVSGNYASGEDVLAFLPAGSITGSFSGSTGVLALSGAASLADYQTALRNVRYVNTSQDPSTAVRTISFQVNDGAAEGNLSSPITREVEVTSVNDAPAIAAGGSISYTENAPAAVVISGLTLSDAEGDTITGATAVISANFESGQDVLSFTPAGDITGSFDGATGVLTLSGNGTAAEYQAVLQTVSYVNGSDSPSTAARTITFKATDSQGDTGTAATTIGNVTAVNDAPVTTVPLNAAVGTAFSNTSLAISGVAVSDVDAGSSNIQATVSAASGGVTFSLAGGASATGNGTGSVVLTGTATQVNAALATLAYKSNDGFTGADTISVIASDLGNTGTGGALQSNGGVANTFQVGVVPQVFIIDNANALADTASAGSAANPFNSIAAFNTLAVDGDGDYIYLNKGTGTYSEADGFNLLGNQQLWGQGQTLQFTNPVTGEVVTVGTSASGATPTISITGANNHAIDLASGNTIKGLNVATTLGSQTGISDSNATVGSLTISDVDVTGVGMGVDIDQGGALNVVFDVLSSSGSTQQGVQLAGTALAALTGSFTATTGSIAGSSGTAFQVGDGGTANAGGTASISYGGTVSSAGASNTVVIEDRATGAGTITLSGNVNHTSSGGNGIYIDDIAAGAITFSGVSNTLNTGTATAISISDVTGGSVTISGMLDIDTTSGTGISMARNTAAVNFTGSQIAINTTSGGAGVVLSGPPEVGGSVVFNNTGNGLDIVTASGAGINATGTGTLTIQGASNTIATTGATALTVSGPTIAATGLNFVSVNSSGGANGIVLASTGSAGGLTITGTGLANSGGTIQSTTGDGIEISGGMFNLVRMLIQNTAGHGMDVRELVGTGNALSNSTINGFNPTSEGGIVSAGNGLNIVNTSSTGTLAVSGTTFSNGTNGNDGIFMEGQGGGNMTLTVTGSTFTGLFGDGIQVNGTSSATGTIRFTVANSSFADAVASTGNGGISMNTVGNTNLFADINTNTFNAVMNAVSTLGAIGMTNGGTADADVTIRNNTISNLAGARGISITADGGTTDLLINNNSVNGLGSISKSAINVNFIGDTIGGTVATGNVTVTGNLIGQTGALWTSGDGNANAILLQTLLGAVMTAAVANNVVDANTNSTFQVLRLRASDNGTLNGTVTGNDLNDTAVATRVEFDATAGTAAAAGTVNLTISGNNLNSGVLQLAENAMGTMSVTQASSAAVVAANSATPITVNLTGTGSPAFGAATPPSASTPALPLLVSGNGSGAGSSPVTQDQFASIVSAAITRWLATGLSTAQRDALQHLSFALADLDGSNLGGAAAHAILIDTDAAGHGWFVDATPLDDAEFVSWGSATHLLASTVASAQGVDLLTAVMHEIGHAMGLSDSYGDAQQTYVMYGYLSAGERRLPAMEISVMGTVFQPGETGP